MSGRGTTNLLTRTTAVLGTVFFILSLSLALLNRGTVGVGRSLLDTPLPPVTAPTVPGAPTGSTPTTTPPGAAAPATPAPAAPSVPTNG